MRIDAYNQVSQLYQATKVKKTAKTSGSSSTDQVEISQSGKDFDTAMNALRQTADVRSDKVEHYQEALASGTYNVSSQEVADSIASKYFDSLF